MLTPKVANIISIVISVLIVIGFSVKIFLDYRNYQKLKDNTIFPPWPAKCPDYWLVKETGVDSLGNETVFWSRGICIPSSQKSKKSYE